METSRRCFPRVLLRAQQCPPLCLTPESLTHPSPNRRCGSDAITIGPVSLCAFDSTPIAAGRRAGAPTDEFVEQSFSPGEEARAVVEGRFLSMRGRLMKMGIPPPEAVLATGGGSNSPAIMQVPGSHHCGTRSCRCSSLSISGFCLCSWILEEFPLPDTAVIELPSSLAPSSDVRNAPSRAMEDPCGCVQRTRVPEDRVRRCGDWSSPTREARLALPRSRRQGTIFSACLRLGRRFNPRHRQRPLQRDGGEVRPILLRVGRRRR